MGKAVMVPVDTVTNQQINSIIPDKTKCHPEYLYYLLSTKQQELKDIAGGSATPILNKGHFGKIQVHLPDIGYQAAAAKILSSFDDKIQLNNQINQTLEQMAQAIFKSWFVDFEPTRAKIAALEAGGSEDDALLAAMQAIAGSALFATDAADADAPTQLARLQTEHPEQYTTLRATAELFPSAMQESELGEIPEGWDALPLYETAEYVNGAAFKATDFSEDRSGLPIVKIAELKQGVSATTQFTNGTFRERYQIESGDILYSWSGSPETSLEVFKWFGGKGWLNQHIFKLSFESEDDKIFTFYLLKFLKPLLIETAKQKQTTGLGHITVADMKRIQTVSPSPMVLREFCYMVSPMFNKSSSLDIENMQLSQLRDSLLPKLLSGEIDLTKIENEVI